MNFQFLTTRVSSDIFIIHELFLCRVSLSLVRACDDLISFLGCTWWLLVVKLVVFWRRSSSVILDLFWSEFSLVLFLRTCLEYSLILKSLSWCVLSFNFYVSIFFFHPLFFHFTFELFKNDASWDLFCKLYLTPSLLIVSSSESIFTVYFSVQRFLFF